MASLATAPSTWVLLTDETNVQPSADARFFAYGGLFLDVVKMPALAAAIRQARESAGYRQGDEFKFDTRSRPAHVKMEDATRAKSEVVAACQQHGARFIAYAALHEIITKKPEMISFGANTVIGGFHEFLELEKASGICVMDRLPDGGQFGYLVKKFTVGLEFPGGKIIALPRIHLFASTCSNASHLSSAVDIVLGAFRYCINNPKNPDAAHDMMGGVASLLWQRGGRFSEWGLRLRPKTVRAPVYQTQYDELSAHIQKLIGNSAAR